MAVTWSTAAKVLNAAAVELGLYSSDVADPVASTDPSLVQMRALLNGLGQDLARDHQWTQLQKEGSFATEDGVSDYDPPADFLRFIDQTAWNRTTHVPLGGPLSPQEWQFLQAEPVGALLYKMVYVQTGQFLLIPAPTGVEDFRYQYVTSSWVCAAAGTAPTADEVTASTQLLWFDKRLLVAGLKLRFREAKGFDTSAEERRFAEALSRAKGGDGLAPVLRIAGPSDYPMISRHNIPDTGFGS